MSIIINVILSFIVANEGSKKEIGFGKSLLLSLFFSPIMAMLFVINSKTKTEEKSIEIEKEVIKINRTYDDLNHALIPLMERKY